MKWIITNGAVKYQEIMKLNYILIKSLKYNLKIIFFDPNI